MTVQDLIRSPAGQWVRRRLSTGIAAQLKRLLRHWNPVTPVTEATLIQAYLDGGRVPWSTGYGEYKRRWILDTLADDSVLERFQGGAPLPDGYGYALDERAVEYPWVVSRLGSAPGFLVDAGSTLAYPGVLTYPTVMPKQVVFCNLAHEERQTESRLSYVTGDIRALPLTSASVDIVTCISTLEHVGCDNTMLYTADTRFREAALLDYRTVVREFRRVLKPQGRLYLTVPFGKPGFHGWFQQFNSVGVDTICKEFGGASVDATYFRYNASGWHRARPDECRDAEYFDIHREATVQPDRAAAARAVVCLEMMR